VGTVLARLLVQLYFLVHGRLHLPGAGWLIRRMVPWVPGLQRYPLEVPGVGTAVLDFRDDAAFSFLNIYLGELRDDRVLHAWLGRLLGPTSVFWDVGANVGYLSMHLVRQPGLVGHIEAFEPNPKTFATLSSLLQNHPRVKVHNLGLGDKDAELEMQLLPGSSAYGSVARRFQDGKTIRVQIRQGDAYQRAQNLPLPDVLKIDVEGFEPQVIEGLAETIRIKRPFVIFEHHFIEEASMRRLTPPGYQLLFLVGEDELTADFSQRMRGIDALLVPEEKAGLPMFRDALRSTPAARPG
jgi:FkbM family methyltransferase